MTQLQKKLTKTKFEELVIDTFGFDNLSARNTKEGSVNLRLYYYKDYHVATWQRGGSWIYDFSNEREEIEAQVQAQNELFTQMRG